MKLTLNPDLKWIATDSVGDVYAYEEKPQGVTACGWKGHPVRVSKSLFNIPDLGEWRDSLHEILPDGELRKYVQPPPGLPVDIKVLVRDTPEEEWKRRHFAEFGEDGRIRCWNEGATSFTATSSTGWKQWKLYKEGEE